MKIVYPLIITVFFSGVTFGNENSKPIKETEIQGVKSISNQENYIEEKDIKPCSSQKDKNVFYLRSSVNMPVKAKISKSKTITEYIDIGDEEGIEVCRDKNNMIRIRVWKNKLFNKQELPEQ